MTYTIAWDEKAREFLRKIHPDDTKRIIKKVNGIVDDPHHYLETLIEITAYKLREGDYRVLIDLQEDKKMISVILIGHRKDIYKAIKRTGFGKK
jgi:mRNA interferase RelE/StbE